MKKLLFIDACIRRNTSRTERLAQEFLDKRRAAGDVEIQTVILEDAALNLLNDASLSLREACIRQGDYSGEQFCFARQFAQADELVIAAPCWDMSFPASLKLYVENVCINGLTFRYSEEGVPIGMTSIKKATYITTSGGYLKPTDLGFEYISSLLSTLFLIPDVQRIAREGLDII